MPYPLIGVQLEGYFEEPEEGIESEDNIEYVFNKERSLEYSGSENEEERKLRKNQKVIPHQFKNLAFLLRLISKEITITYGYRGFDQKKCRCPSSVQNSDHESDHYCDNSCGSWDS